MIEQLDLTAYLRPLLRWWWLLVAAMLVAMVSSFFYTSSQPAIYTARATIMVGSSIKDPNPNGAEFYLAGQLAAAYADIAGRAPLYQATKEALNMPWLPAYSIAQIAGGPVIEVLVYDGDPQRAYMVADELVKQVIALGPQEEQSRQAFIDQQLTKLQDSITQTEATIAQRENELLNIDSARELANQQAEIKALQEKASSLQQNYANLLATTQRGAANTLRVLEPPSVPTSPIDSGLAKNILVAALVAFALAASAAYLLEYLDNTFRDGDEMKRALDVTLLGSVPSIPGLDDNPAQKLIMLQLGPTPMGEAYRRIRTNLEFASVDRNLRIVLVTSAQSRDGKSLTAANLSISLANSGKNVVLIDADLHRPTQQRLFKLQNHAGLTTALLTEDAKLDGLLQPTGVPRLSVLTSGPLPPNPAELLGSRRFQEILSRLQTTTDIIILDSPPVTAVVDSLILSTRVDGLILVVRSGKTIREATKRSLSALRQVHAHILGAVFTDVPNPKMDLYNLDYGYYNKAYSHRVTTGKSSNGAAAQGQSASTKQEVKATHINGKGTASATNPAPRVVVDEQPDIHPTQTSGEDNGGQTGTKEPTLANAGTVQDQVNGTFKQIVRRRSGLPWQ